MRQIITLAALAAIAVGGWLAWPTIKAKFLADNPAPPKDPGPTTPTPPAPPTPIPPNPVTPDLGAKTPTISPEAKTQEPVIPAGNPAKTPELPPNAKTVRVDLTAEVVFVPPPFGVGTWTYAVEGTTTLPAGAELQTWVIGEGEKTPDRSQPGGAKLVVVKALPRNTFRSQPVNLPVGKTCRLMLALRPESQPPAIQQLIGGHGELLTGPLVLAVDKETAVGKENDKENYVQAISASFPLPTAGAAASKARRVKLVFKAGDGEPAKNKTP